jgi:hypothetical protein
VEEGQGFQAARDAARRTWGVGVGGGGRTRDPEQHLAAAAAARALIGQAMSPNP